MSAVARKDYNQQVLTQRFNANFHLLSSIHLINTPYSLKQVFRPSQVDPTVAGQTAPVRTISVDANTDPYTIDEGDRCFLGNMEGIIEDIDNDGTKLNAVQVLVDVEYNGQTDYGTDPNVRKRRIMYVVNNVNVTPEPGQQIIYPNYLSLNGGGLQVVKN